jgi:hypothetical protein
MQFFLFCYPVDKRSAFFLFWNWKRQERRICESLWCDETQCVGCVTFPRIFFLFHLCTLFKCFTSSTSKFFPPTCFTQCNYMLLHSPSFESEWSIWNFLSCRKRDSIRFETGDRKDSFICTNNPQHEQHS